MRRCRVLSCLRACLFVCVFGPAAAVESAGGSASPLPAAAQAASAPAAAAPVVAARPLQPAGRPRIGLVLSGGGARGLAHVGVLKVLERERIPIDAIAGTSMGAIIGGLYASGMSAEVLERELLKVDWDQLFATRVARRELSQRRKETDFEIAWALEIGLRDGELRVPIGTLSSRGLESLLRRYTLPVRAVRDFDRLPTPFRAVATDMETGQPLVLKEGDLALAMRSSMSVPGVFAPTEIEGRILGDGGLVNNLPIDVVRAMGVDVVIAVNIGTPLGGRETLGSLLGVTSQMINILTEQNVQRSLVTLTPRDLLIAPQLGALTSADFAKTTALIELGELQTAQKVLELQPYGIDAASYQAWTQARTQPGLPQPTLGFVKFEGNEVTQPGRFAAALETRPGQPFAADAAERDARRLAASGDYTRVDYQLVRDGTGDDGVVFNLEEKPWGPNYFRFGIGLSTDFSGRSSFNIKIAHVWRWLDAAGSEWRNGVQIGSNPGWLTEWYHPLGWSTSLGSDWFIAPTASIDRKEVVTYASAEGPESGRFRRSSVRLGLDLGQPWGEFGELRLGPYLQRWDDKTLIVSSDFAAADQGTERREVGLRLRAVVDQLDYAFFAQEGYRLVGEVARGKVRNGSDAGDAEQDFSRIEANVNFATTWATKHTLNFYGSTLFAGRATPLGRGLYTLGGFQNLSGYKPGQVEGNYLLFGRASYYYRLTPPALTRGFFAGFSLEAGNAWAERRQMSLGDLRTGMSAFLGADTGLGPLYLGLAYAPRGETALYLLLGRP
ncbi:patatin-like phospholipase family protein [Methylibium sp.]|uniref:patatin-like phospholipase family protein n=1 Tax=Methylibium sp. TaxID=2067992 RepID=UPI003D0C76BA